MGADIARMRSAWRSVVLGIVLLHFPCFGNAVEHWCPESEVRTEGQTPIAAVLMAL